MVETDRLLLVPLTYHQLIKYLKAGDQLEEELSLLKTGRIVSEDVKEMVESFTLPKMKQAHDLDYIYYTFWIAVDKLTRVIVAELGFKGLPDRNNCIEIGYGTMPGHTGKGYMTEAVSGMVKWALQLEDVKCILAETYYENMASIRILQKNGFQQFDKRGEMLWWRKLKAQ